MYFVGVTASFQVLSTLDPFLNHLMSGGDCPGRTVLAMEQSRERLLPACTYRSALLPRILARDSAHAQQRTERERERVSI